MSETHSHGRNSKRIFVDHFVSYSYYLQGLNIAALLEYDQQMVMSVKRVSINFRNTKCKIVVCKQGISWEKMFIKERECQVSIVEDVVDYFIPLLNTN